MAHGIIVFGASGSGTTTLGKALAARLGFAHLDLDDYYWEWDTPVPYSVNRGREARIAMLLGDIERAGRFVISGSMNGWCEPFLPMFDLAVFVEAPARLRVTRLKARESAAFGERIRIGGDMHKAHLEFLEWAAQYDAGYMPGRNRRKHAEWAKGLPCPVITLDGTRPAEELAERVVGRFYVNAGEPWRVVTHGLGALRRYRYTVVFARYTGKWLFCRHKARDTWETAGGHIKPGETPLDCARRELREETGAAAFTIAPAFDYAVHGDREFSYGQVFLAHVDELGELPESEMAEARLFDSLPEHLTYPAITPILYERINKLGEK